MIIALNGYANSGKDTVADMLAMSSGFTKVALADPLKRIAKEVYDFSVSQLWGPSAERNKPDKRYPRRHTWHGNNCLCCGAHADGPEGEDGGFSPVCYLTPRYALQLLGTEWGRHCYENTWIDLALRVVRTLNKVYVVNEALFQYSQYSGLYTEGGVYVGGPTSRDVVIPDTRYLNELNAVKEAGGKTVRIKRKGEPAPRFSHTSETAQAEIPDGYFDYILYNISDLHHLRLCVDGMMDVFSGRIIPYDEAQTDVPPF